MVKRVDRPVDKLAERIYIQNKKSGGKLTNKEVIEKARQIAIRSDNASNSQR